jgi:hydroxypyruvate isomerase
MKTPDRETEPRATQEPAAVEQRPSTTRRRFLTAATAAAAGLPLAAAAAAATPAASPIPVSGPPRFVLSPNLELLFPRTMSYEDRLQAVADAGARAYSIWAFAGKNLDKLRSLADRHGIRCASMTGANKTGFNTGLTKTGEEKAFLDDFSEAVRAARVVGAPNLITFVGERQPGIAPETQHAQIVSGLKKAGDIAGAAGVYLTLEPLSVVTIRT